MDKQLFSLIISGIILAFLVFIIIQARKLDKLNKEIEKTNRRLRKIFGMKEEL